MAGAQPSANVPSRDDDKGMRVNIGVRPEDFMTSDGKDFIYNGEVNITEALGEVTLLYFHPDGGNNPMIGKLPGIHSDLRGKSISMTAAPEKVHIFRDGKSLLYREPH